jgi:gluconate kinase
MVKRNNLYTQTRDDIRKMTSGHTNENERKTMGLTKKNPKIHFTHLQGRRQKVIERFQGEKKRAKD